jgi:hypothetical protein
MWMRTRGTSCGYVRLIACDSGARPKAKNVTWSKVIQRTRNALSAATRYIVAKDKPSMLYILLYKSSMKRE